MTDEPRLTADEIIQRLEATLSPWRRVRALTALLAGAAGAVFVSALWWTEPGPLPGRTQLAFAAFTAFCLAWACYGAWLSTRGTPLFARDRVIAGWIALAAALLTTALVAAVAAGALVFGLAFVVVAAVLTVRAHTTRARLLRLKRDLGG
ncbi:hypothetical protein ACIBIZ_23710 [Nonomuraea spiralis]|uniref:hypothetical protein n=1 Tax=Nonomuraea TaxID=83681 RepID=UPI000F794103|nr:hypothetical protein [Nonomuraea sp. WAC 01424]RSN10271.1 hypothetical protein DMB42_15115 [Nonomuraea sp. WAC 01424]